MTWCEVITLATTAIAGLISGGYLGHEGGMVCGAAAGGAIGYVIVHTRRPPIDQRSENSASILEKSTPPNHSINNVRKRKRKCKKTKYGSAASPSAVPFKNPETSDATDQSLIQQPLSRVVLLRIYCNNIIIKEYETSVASTSELDIYDCTYQQLIDYLFQNNDDLKEYDFKNKLHGKINENTKLPESGALVLEIDISPKATGNDILKLKVMSESGPEIDTYFLDVSKKISFNGLKQLLEKGKLNGKYIIVKYRYDGGTVGEKDMPLCILNVVNKRTSGSKRPTCFSDIKELVAVVEPLEEYKKKEAEKEKKTKAERMQQEKKLKIETTHRYIKSAYSYRDHERNDEAQELVCSRYDLFVSCGWSRDKIRATLGDKYTDLKLGDVYGNLSEPYLPGLDGDKEYLEFYVLSGNAKELDDSSRPGTPRFVISSDIPNPTSVYFSNHYNNYIDLKTGKKIPK